MKVTFEYSLPDDEYELLAAKNAVSMAAAIEEFKQYLRGRLKYEEMTDEKYSGIDEVRDKFFQILGESGVNLL